jgi:hypothetical protein
MNVFVKLLNMFKVAKKFFCGISCVKNVDKDKFFPFMDSHIVTHI